MFKTIKNDNIEVSITEKKSKFICNIFHVESIEEAEQKLNEIRKKYHDARHNCYAYKIACDDVSRQSDDGEPSGTAGTPIMNILNGNNLSNILVVVTRYFGGILLGTGGLVRAYSLSTSKAIDEAEIVSQVYGLQAEFMSDYKILNEIKYYLKNKSIKIVNIEYLEKIKFIVEGKKEDIEELSSNKLSDRIMLQDLKIIGKKYITV